MNAQFLQRCGYETLTAESAEKVLEILITITGIRAVISDIDMVLGMKCDDLLAQVKKDHPAIICILLSGNSEGVEGARSKYSDVINAFILKPCPLLNITTTLQRELQAADDPAKKDQ